MNICGILVHAYPDNVTEVASALGRIPGVELHGQADGGRLIVTIEDTTSSSAIDGLGAIHALPGVVAAALVYHHFDSVPGEAGTHAMEA